MQDHIQHVKKGSVPRISSEKKGVILLMIILSVLKYKAFYRNPSFSRK